MAGYTSENGFTTVQRGELSKGVLAGMLRQLDIDPGES